MHVNSTQEFSWNLTHFSRILYIISTLTHTHAILQTFLPTQKRHDLLFFCIATEEKYATKKVWLFFIHIWVTFNKLNSRRRWVYWISRSIYYSYTTKYMHSDWSSEIFCIELYFILNNLADTVIYLQTWPPQFRLS